MEILDTYLGERIITLQKFKDAYLTKEGVEKEFRYGIYVDDTRYIWARRRGHAEDIFNDWKETLSNTPRNTSK